MSRYRGQKALYEVIGEAGTKPRSNRRPALEPLHAPQEFDKNQGEPSEATKPAHNEQIRWAPRAVQFNAGRIEFSLPYPVVFVLLLGLLFVTLLGFKLGQYSRSGAGQVAPNSGQEQKTGVESGKTGALRNPGLEPAGREQNSQEKPFDATVSPGNAIVIQQHHSLMDLVPVKRFFAERGIDTEIIKAGNTFFLVTAERFGGNPEKEGSPGYELKQQIRRLGKEYKAPANHARFADFGDTYGKYFSEQFQGEVVNVD